MKRNILTPVLTFVFCALLLTANAQDRFTVIDQSLKQLVNESPGLNETTNSSFTASTIGYIKPYSVFRPMVKSTVGLAKKRFKSPVI